jgi:hypothetical protein
VAVLMLVACGGGTTTASPKASPPNHAVAERCARLVQRGIAPCPPADLEWLKAPIANGTGGSVSQNDAQRWGEAALRTETYYQWAVKQASSNFLQSGALAPVAAAQMNLFSFELQAIQEAQQAHGSLVFQAARITRVRVVAMPSQLQKAAQAQQLQPAADAMVISLVGPFKLAIHRPDGTDQIKSQGGANEGYSILVWGEYRNDSELGPIWYEYGYYSCEDAQVQAACAS